MQTELVRDGYIVSLSEPEIYVNHEANGRSGHVGHAMAEFAPDTIIDFNANTSNVRSWGHSLYGWTEYRISRDAGRTYSAPRLLPYAWQSFLDGLFTIGVEKAVACDDGRIVAFCLRSTMLKEICCEPWLTPTVIYSDDGGDTWSEARECAPYAGRVYDAIYRDGVIYMIMLCNDGEENFVASKPEHVYRLYISRDRGESFRELCVIPTESIGRAYCDLLFDPQGLLHFYAYNANAEREMDHLISGDGGKTWSRRSVCYVAKGIRNPQTAVIDGVYILHGRGEDFHGFVLYSSLDGHHWDEGVYLEQDKKHCYYSNNILLRDTDGSSVLLMQYSDTYKDARVNVMHRWLRIKR